MGVVSRMRVAEVAGVVDRLDEPDGLEILLVLLGRVDERIAHLLDELLLVGGRLPLLDRIGLGARGILFGHHPLVERERPRRRGRTAVTAARGDTEHHDRREKEDQSLQDA